MNFTLHADTQLAACMDCIKRVYADKDKLYCVTVAEDDPKRTTEQNARHWARMQWLEDNAKWKGRHISRESWHYTLLVETGFIEGVVERHVDGLGWIEIPLAERTHSMGKRRFKDMEDGIDLYLAEKLGIAIPDINDELWAA